jgi:hypothetical protein
MGIKGHQVDSNHSYLNIKSSGLYERFKLFQITPNLARLESLNSYNSLCEIIKLYLENLPTDFSQTNYESTYPEYFFSKPTTPINILFDLPNGTTRKIQ